MSEVFKEDTHLTYVSAVQYPTPEELEFTQREAVKLAMNAPKPGRKKATDYVDPIQMQQGYDESVKEYKEGL